MRDIKMDAYNFYYFLDSLVFVVDCLRNWYKTCDMKKMGVESCETVKLSSDSCPEGDDIFWNI